MHKTTKAFHRPLGRSGIQVSAVGLGCRAIGGQFYNEQGQPLGWGDVDDDESIRAIHCAMDWGVNFFDTAVPTARGTGRAGLDLGRSETTERSPKTEARAYAPRPCFRVSSQLS
jgi:hypothetical protein